MTNTPEPAFRSLDHISSNAQDTSKLAALSARIADLEAQLYAIGAGGVGQSIKPQIQVDTAPAAWAIYSDDGTAIRLWSRDKAAAQDAADKFGLPLVPLYAAPQPPAAQQEPVAWKWRYKNGELSVTSFDTRAQCERNSDDTAGEAVPLYTQPQPPAPQQKPVAWINWNALTGKRSLGWECDSELASEPLYAAPQPAIPSVLCDRICAAIKDADDKSVEEADSMLDSNDCIKIVREQFAAAHQPVRQPLTDEKMYSLYCEAMKGYYVSSLHHWRNAEAHKFARAIEAAVANQPPPRQPLTVETFTKLAHRMATKYTHRSDPSFAGYAFLPHTLEQFVRAIEAAHGITWGQP